MDTTMELDELKQAWQAMAQRVDSTSALGIRLYRENRLDRIRRTLRWLMAGQVLQIAIWIGVITVVAPFWIEHRAVPHLLAFGLILHAYAVATIIGGVVQLLLMAAIDYAAPVLTLQRRLVRLRTLRIWINLVLSVMWWPLWIVGFVVGVKWWLGVDLYIAAPGFVLANVVFGLAALAATAWFARRIARRAKETGRPARFADDLAGHSLRRAIGQLDEIAKFERE
ncbi:hypothetical protein ACFPOA_01095 [Lysobacter niabensis]|uniref:hypothetical protein n=1 Tax=Agrilutibacter niabensis TaxID=380628 RepID=UPI003610AE6B